MTGAVGVGAVEEAVAVVVDAVGADLGPGAGAAHDEARPPDALGARAA